MPHGVKLYGYAVAAHDYAVSSRKQIISSIRLREKSRLRCLNIAYNVVFVYKHIYLLTISCTLTQDYLTSVNTFIHDL